MLVGIGTAPILIAPKNADREGGRVEEQQHDPLFGPDVELVAQRAAESIDPLGQLGVGDALVAALNRDGGAPPSGEDGNRRSGWRR